MKNILVTISIYGTNNLVFFKKQLTYLLMELIRKENINDSNIF